MPEVDTLLLNMLEAGGSDMHLASGESPKMRVDGVIQTMDFDPIGEEVLAGMMREITPPYRWMRFAETGDADLAHEIPEAARFRVNLYKNHWGTAAVFRQIPSQVQSIDDLGLPQVLKTIAMYNEGLVLVTGPTGSGKSTSLAAMINHINTKVSRKIITLEDPVEYTHTPINSLILHREVGEQARSFSGGLRSAMRSDPDVILIGELRDRETIKLALNSAAMGMLVFATLHTNNAVKTVDRIIDAFPSEEQNQVRVMLADALRACVSQLLCKQINGGRIASHEILTAHESLPNVIRTNALSSIRNIIDQNRDKGMISMDQCLRDYVQRGYISPQEAYMKAIDKQQFAV